MRCFLHPPTLPTSRDRLFAYIQAIAQGGIAGLVIHHGNPLIL
jgi:hypothetical protein